MVKPEKLTIDKLVRRAAEDAEFFVPAKQLIVTVQNQRQAENVADYLWSFGVGVRYLHSQIEPDSRELIEGEFSGNVFQVLVVPKSFSRHLPPFGRIPRVSLV